ncbi:MAG: replication initiator protein A [Actinomycetota bacterium]
MARVANARRERTKAVVPAEGNFEEHPYFRVGDRNAGTGILQYENELRTRDGNVLQQSWVVRAAHGRGLPGRYDQDVYVALLQLIDNRGLPEDGWVSFSIYELVELMGKRHSGREYQQVRESLQRLATTTIESRNAFYHKGRKAYITDTFSLLTEVKLSEYEGPAGERKDRNRVHLSQYFVDSYKANYLKNIDAKFYWSLSSPIAKRLYRLIDKKRGGRRLWEVEIFSLKERIPLSDYKYASKIKEKLQPAHEELISKGFLERVVYRKANGVEYVVYEITESFHARRSAAVLRQPTGEEVFCVQRLVAEGMARDAAEEIVASYGTARTMHYVEALPYQKNLRNPAGWLRKAIENGYDLDLPPALFEPSEDESSPRLEPPSEDTVEPAPAAQRDPRAQQVWDAVVEAASREIEDASLEVWLSSIFPTALEDDALVLAAPNPFAKEYIQTRFANLLDKALREHLSSPTATVRVVVGRESRAS